MKWTTHTRPKTPMDPAYSWQEANLDTSVVGLSIDFLVEKARRCYIATMVAAGNDTKVGDYATERLAKAACRRKAGRIVQSLQRGIRDN